MTSSDTGEVGLAVGVSPAPEDSRTNAGRRDVWTWAWTGLALASGVGMLLSVAGASWSDLAKGSGRDNLVTALVYLGLISTTVAVIRWTRRRTPPGGITPWRRVGATAAVLWAGAVVVAVLTYGLRLPALSVALVPLYPFMLFLVPVTLWSPLWVVAAAVRGRQSPERVSTRLSGVQPPVAVPPASGELPEQLGLVRVPTEVDAATAADAPTPEASSRRRRIVIVACVMAAILAVLVLDQAVRAQELSRLTNAIEASESAMESTNRELAVLIAQPRGTTELQQSFEDAVRRTAANGGVALELSRHEIASITPMPWHRQIATLQEDYLAHVDAWRSKYQGLASAADGAAMDTVDRASLIPIKSTFEIAGAAAVDAVPALFAGDLAQRLGKVFES